MAKTKFIFGVHNHQPVGNFDFVFQGAFERAYQPFLDVAVRHPAIALSFHFSGPLLEWLEVHQPDYLDRVAALAATGRVEILSGGFYEPILSMIPDHDKLGQIRKMNAYLAERFNYQARGLWLTERVWEPHLALPISQAGISYLPVDDYHFLSAGLEAGELAGYYLTEEQNATIGMFPISQQLRYAIPFKDPERTIEVLRAAGELGDHPVQVMMDDGEKFGLWPGTWGRCYGRDRWLERFFVALEENSDWLETTTFGEVYDSLPPAGRVYLPTASYFEMSQWTLPPQSGARLDQFLEDLEERQAIDQVRPFVRGGTWRNFLAKYPEANWMQKRVFQVSQKIASSLRESGETTELVAAQDDLWRSQCNCAFWHGIFGGLYLPHLRHAIYSHLLRAEAVVDKVTDGCRFRLADIDCDGREEIEVTTPYIKAFVTPLGGALKELDILPVHFNLLDTMSRYRESYHRRLESAETGKAGDGSIHKRQRAKEPHLEKHLQVDTHPRHMLLDHFFTRGTTVDQVQRNTAAITNGLATAVYDCAVKDNSVICTTKGPVLGETLALSKTIAFEGDKVSVELEIANEGHDAVKGLYGLEFNFALLGGHTKDRYYLIDGRKPADPYLDAQDELAGVSSVALVSEYEGIKAELRFKEPATVWRYPVKTVNMSEDGFERVYQSSVVLPVWPLDLPAGERFRLELTLQATVFPAL